jgi:uncharacterized Tic20 family protein
VDNEPKGKTDMTTTTNEAVPAAVSADSRTWAMLSHLSAFVMFLGIPAIVGPLVAWAIKKNDDPYIDYHGKEAVNFNLSFLIYGAASALLILAVVGLVLLPIVALTWFVLVIVASVKANSGEYYQYPFTIRFLR